MEIITDEIFDPEQLNITIIFDTNIAEHENTLREIISSWFTIGFWGGFTGKIIDLSEIWCEEKEIGFSVDMSNSTSESLDVLFHVLKEFAELNGLEFKKTVIGNTIY